MSTHRKRIRRDYTIFNVNGVEEDPEDDEYVLLVSPQRAEVRWRDRGNKLVASFEPTGEQRKQIESGHGYVRVRPGQRLGTVNS